MAILLNEQFDLPIHSPIFRDEGPQGYLLRLAETNLLLTKDLMRFGVSIHYDSLLASGNLPHIQLDPQLHQYAQKISDLWMNTPRIWNLQFARFCPHCLSDNGYWRAEWELQYYDVCHIHAVNLVDNCSSCHTKLNWHRNKLLSCDCGSALALEKSSKSPAAMVKLSSYLSHIYFDTERNQLPAILAACDIEQAQRLCRYMGNHLSEKAAKFKLKTFHEGDLINSWPITSLTAELLDQWPTAFHQALANIEKVSRQPGIPSLKQVFGESYHYLFKAMKDEAFKELRYQFELWVSKHWKAGVAKRNKRLSSTMLEKAAWVPASFACEHLGISHQHLQSLIKERVIEGETHVSTSGRKFVMVRRDQLGNAKEQLFGQIDLVTAGKLLGIRKMRMRKLLTLLLKDVKRITKFSNTPWRISRMEVNQLIEVGMDYPVVTVIDEDCVSMTHILKYWTWTNEDIADFILTVRNGEIPIINRLEGLAGLAAWNFRLQEIKLWHSRKLKGLGSWLTISQAAKMLGVKEQVGYELVKLNLMKAEIAPHQMKRGTRVHRTAVETFHAQYVFGTEICSQLHISPKKLFSFLEKQGIKPISGPQVNGARQNLYLRTEHLNQLIKEMLNLEAGHLNIRPTLN